jgi:alkylhydroperoxidase family enzyme
MSRLSHVQPSDWPRDLREFVQADTATDIELGITRMLAHAPKAALASLQFGAGLVMNRTLPERMIELLRLRIAFHNQCKSCMAIRYRAAVSEVPEDLVCSLDQPECPTDLSAEESIVLALGDRFATHHLAIDDAFFAELRQHFTEAQIIELLLHCALYVGMGRLAAVLDMTEELPEGFAKPFGTPVGLSADQPIIVR